MAVSRYCLSRSSSTRISPVAGNRPFCDSQTVYGRFRENRALRKSVDPRLASFRALRKIQ